MQRLSSDARNNARTGYAANCELNYTPERPDGTIDISGRSMSTSSLISRVSSGPLKSAARFCLRRSSLRYSQIREGCPNLVESRDYLG
jgi:hypothetical protein